VELRNAVDQANKEITNRSTSRAPTHAWSRRSMSLTIYAADDFKLGQV
jgi:uncharacterized protein YajQ (UPF0234 family)